MSDDRSSMDELRMRAPMRDKEMKVKNSAVFQDGPFPGGMTDPSPTKSVRRGGKRQMTSDLVRWGVGHQRLRRRHRSPRSSGRWERMLLTTQPKHLRG